MSRIVCPRREFLGRTLAGATSLPLVTSAIAPAKAAVQSAYTGPRVVIVRFGGGVRRRETIDPQHTYSPFFRHELVPRGTFFPQMEISVEEGDNTSHGEGTLNILTGKYGKYKDVEDRFLGARFEAQVPTVFEYLRKMFAVPDYQTLIVNGEDRTDEEFYSFSNHHLFGVAYRCHVLSLYRFKTYLLRRQIEEGRWNGRELQAKREELQEAEALDYRRKGEEKTSPRMQAFWEKWRGYYGETGLVNPRGDRVLTELAIRAMRELEPRLMMVNYNDCDYVHWGNINFYTRGIAIMDDGLRRLVDAANQTEGYRDNTVFVVVPDCGRDNNRMMAVPCQHHFNSASARKIFALFFGPGIEPGRVVDRPVEQQDVAATIGELMGFPTPFAEGSLLEEVAG